jgi:calcium permeable stress-gated cation channel
MNLVHKNIFLPYRNDCNKDGIKNYLQQLFPDIFIEDIQLAYNIKKLVAAAVEYEK